MPNQYQREKWEREAKEGFLRSHELIDKRDRITQNTSPEQIMSLSTVGVHMPKSSDLPIPLEQACRQGFLSTTMPNETYQSNKEEPPQIIQTPYERQQQEDVWLAQLGI